MPPWLASGELQRKLRSLKRLEAPEAMESSPDRTDEACWYRAVIFQNITASVRPRFYWEIESFYGCGCNPDGHLPSIAGGVDQRSEEQTSELQSLMRIAYAVFCLKKQKN